MKFVALVSGGKDSCFNILHCLAQGHELECLANLYPPQEDNDEIDSYMYQTVGHDVLTLYEKCIGKPMYRQAILGNPSNQKLEYNKTENDETEDLFNLLSTVLKNHPDVKGVSVGAILSSYQRTRVEDVCSRLGLVSLAYLWQRDQGELMNEMCLSGMDARIIKVAAIGLDDSNLGMSLQEIHPRLIQLNQMFGVHICGEGGEFETSVLDAPFFKFGKIEIVGKEIIKHTNDDVWYLKMKVTFKPKEQVDDEVVDWSQFLSEPPLLNEKFQEIYDNMNIDIKEPKKEEKYIKNLINWECNIFETKDKIYVSNLNSEKITVEDQIVDIFEQLNKILVKFAINFENIQSSKLLINDMKNFVDINSLYVKYFTKPLPPSRICVETTLPVGKFAQLSVVILKTIENKQGLHVQGRSYWAPCNIGPYSQAVSNKEDRIVRISGQIPLVPKNMDLSNKEDVKLSTILSLQHYNSIKEVTNFNSNLITVCFIKNSNLKELASTTFKEYLDVCESNNTSKGNDNLLIVQVTELPKGADVEWGGLSYQEETGYMNYESDSEDEDGSNDVKNKAIIHYVNKLSEFKFKTTANSEGTESTPFYEIYAFPSQLDDKDVAVLMSLSGYELFPVVQCFNTTLEGDKIGIVEYHM